MGYIQFYVNLKSVENYIYEMQNSKTSGKTIIYSQWQGNKVQGMGFLYIHH